MAMQNMLQERHNRRMKTNLHRLDTARLSACQVLAKPRQVRGKSDRVPASLGGIYVCQAGAVEAGRAQKLGRVQNGGASNFEVEDESSDARPPGLRPQANWRLAVAFTFLCDGR